MKTGLVSVIIPTYNRCELLPRAMDSVLNQTYGELELIIVDDGSTDGTEELVLGYEDSRVRLIKSEKNSGAHAARNRGIESSKGEYIAFQDSDDEWLPQKLQQQMALMTAADDTVGMVCSSFLQIFPDGRKAVCPDFEEVSGNCSGFVMNTLLRTPLAGTPTMLIRRKVLEDVGVFDETLSCLEDYELSIRIAQKYQLLMIEEPLVNSYFSGNGINAVRGDALRVRSRLLKKYRTEYLAAGLFETVVASLIRDALEVGIQGEISMLIAEALI